MARNEEKQLGKLNRLWLQKEREEGRIKDVTEPRPKLATLNSVAAVKKWIPSIKNEIEYYLQQSQLSHYPERKIAEFQQQIEQLEKEYKRYLNKLRSLDPTCKHKPWTPRAYSKRRQDSDSGQCTVKRLCAPDPCSQASPAEAATTSTLYKQDLLNQSTPGATSPSDLPDQDLPLSFDRTRLAVAVAGSWRTPSGQLQDMNTLASVLRSGLPNLHSSIAPAGGLQESLETKHPPCTEITQNKTEHVLGLGCYSSSDEET
ncbi:uncharacterized protein si:dkey-86e18.1 [Colossoma macropomum]|uniref:uncharacterized protein si:dkey-86e18.1 n=1 Tax=Colossoma macropomum TaxID=42526 RepID=UPI00186537EB|nr:uncharacterized protein si:dkey-86e18.1 [Colossoma macropomum]